MLANHKIGNDIVDFSQDETKNKYKDSRFLARVFSEEEITAILAAENKAHFLWALWSAKEAAYKACKKQNAKCFFSPKAFRVASESLAALASCGDFLVGVLNYQQQRLDLQWTSPSDAVIHCCAILSENNLIFTRWDEIHQLIKKIGVYAGNPPTQAQQSKILREEFTDFLEDRKIGKNLKIIRFETNINGRLRKGPPLLFEDDIPRTDCDISLSHDHEWIAAQCIQNF